MCALTTSRTSSVPQSAIAGRIPGVTIRSYLRIFRERRKLIALVVVLAVGIAALVTALTPKTYQADVQVFVSSNGDNSSGSTQYDQQAAAISQVTTFAQ